LIGDRPGDADKLAVQPGGYDHIGIRVHHGDALRIADRTRKARGAVEFNDLGGFRDAGDLILDHCLLEVGHRW
jgi:hypothetical protein